jgi:hypothetical protein
VSTEKQRRKGLSSLRLLLLLSLSFSTLTSGVFLVISVDYIMGSSQSQEKPAEVLQKPSFVRTSASESAAVGEYTGPPRIRRLETFDEKLYRKVCLC